VLSAHAISKAGHSGQVAGWLGNSIRKPHTILKSLRHPELAHLQHSPRSWSIIPEPIAVMGIGPTLAVAPGPGALGSRLVYGYLDQPAAGPASAKTCAKWRGLNSFKVRASSPVAVRRP